MKRIFTMIAVVLLAMSLSNSAFAHSHLAGSNPADGDVVTEALNEIILEFDGQIEKGSFLDLTTTSGQDVELQEILVEEGKLIGTLAEPLSNDEYQVNWSIISVDSHPVEGEFGFTVNASVVESVEETETELPEVTDLEEEKTEEVLEEEKEESSSSTTVILIVLIVIVVAGGFFGLTRRKK